MSGANIARNRNAEVITRPISAPGGMVLKFSMRRLFRMPESGIGNDRGYVGNDVQSDVDGREYEADGLHHRYVALRDVVDQILPHAGVDEDHFNHDHAHDEKG